MAPGGSRFRVRHALAGIGAGVAGAIFVLAFLMFGSLWYHRSAWLPANLFSTAVYGSNAYVNRYASTSWSGLAIVFVMYGTAGAVWGALRGALWSDGRPRFLLFYGVLCGVITYFLLFHLFWRRLDPLVALYAPDRQLEFANILWGILVARSSVFSDAREHETDPLKQEHQQDDALAVRSGEVIR